MMKRNIKACKICKWGLDTTKHISPRMQKENANVIWHGICCLKQDRFQNVIPKDEVPDDCDYKLEQIVLKQQPKGK